MDEIQNTEFALPKLHYFDQDEADADDILLQMAKHQGYVPDTCLLGGATVMSEIRKGNNPCHGCAGPREKCKGTPEQRQVWGAR